MLITCFNYILTVILTPEITMVGIPSTSLPDTPAMTGRGGAVPAGVAVALLTAAERGAVLAAACAVAAALWIATEAAARAACAVAAALWIATEAAARAACEAGAEVAAAAGDAV